MIEVQKSFVSSTFLESDKNLPHQRIDKSLAQVPQLVKSKIFQRLKTSFSFLKL